MLISRIALKNPKFTIMVFFILLFVGAIAYQNIPRYENPQLEIPGINVVITFPGASPEDVEELVVEPLEEEINQIDKITKLESDIRNGFARIRIEFELTEDKTDKNSEVLQKINRLEAGFPEGVNIETFEFSLSNIQIMQIALLSPDAGYDRLRKTAERLEDEIEAVYGVSSVDIEAAPEKRVLVDLDFDKLAKYRISPGQVVQTIQGNNANIPAGNLQIGKRSFNLQTSGAYENIEEIKNSILRSLSSQPIRVKDVADVYFSYENYSYTARYDQQRSIFLSIYPQEKVNALPTIAKIKEKIQAYEER
ncbi:MAG: efflux RND transporter permease subunit, partial [Bacteroidota bacterium]